MHHINTVAIKEVRMTGSTIPSLMFKDNFAVGISFEVVLIAFILSITKMKEVEGSWLAGLSFL